MPGAGQSGENLVWALLDRRPDAVDVFVLVELMKKFAHVIQILLGKFGILFGNVTKLAGNHGPAIARKPFGNFVDSLAFANETRAGSAFGYIIVLRVAEGFHFIGTGLNGGSLAIGTRVGVIGFDEPDVVK